MAEIYRESSNMTLRQEALNRVREMQRRAQFMTEQSGEPPSQSRREKEIPDNISLSNTQQQRNTARPQQNPNTPPLNILGQLFGQQKTNQRQSGTGPNGISDLLKRQGLGDSIVSLGDTVQNTVSLVSQPLAELLESFGIDGEKLIIMMVMWSVFNNSKENKTLLMALGYLLL